mmetsp:Transcript_113498/g.321148  ORF Transcript_113498/g.321148 Transcript_113498/m.321148 type:complete len:273 (+) Transcript_113498:179-997(+)
MTKSTATPGDKGDEPPKKTSRTEAAVVIKEEPAPEASKDAPATNSKDFSQWELESDEFVITVTLAGKDILGLDVDWADGKTLYIKGVKNGVVKEWNRDHPDEAVKGGDRIIAINGVADDPDAMLGECRNRGRLSLLVRGQVDRTAQRARAKQKLDAPMVVQDASPQPSLGPDESVVSVDTLGQALGLDVDWADGRTLYIRSMHPGAIENWNRSRPPDQVVQPGCIIVAVNGLAGDTEAMVQQCRSQRRLQLIVRGPPMPDAKDRKDKKKDRK